jgi:hypothetical protein
MLDAAWKPRETAHAAIAFAQDYATVVEADWSSFLRARGRVSQDLGL